MTHYAITQVHFENDRSASVLFARRRNTGRDDFGLAERVDTNATEIAHLLAVGHRIHVEKILGPGENAQADEVRLRLSCAAFLHRCSARRTSWRAPNCRSTATLRERQNAEGSSTLEFRGQSPCAVLRAG